jgi:hypothetical protein
VLTITTLDLLISNENDARQYQPPKGTMTEHQEQVMFFKIVEIRARNDKRLQNVFAIPNAAKRTPRQGRWMTDEGLKAGVPDIFAAIPVGKHHGLFLEMKRVKPKGRLTPNQKDWLERLSAAGYDCAVAYGCDHAIALLNEYLIGETK